MSKKILPILFFLLLVPSLLVNLLLSQKTKTNYQGELVVEVVDGDTFFTKNRQPIRLYGLDAPELGFCYSQEALQKLKELVLDKKVILAEPRTDHTGRILALVYVDRVLVNEILIKEGFALYRRQGGTATDILKQANDYARQNNLGIFNSACYQPNPPDPKCPIKGNITVSNGKKIYFLPECGNYGQTIIEKFRGEQYFCDSKEAVKAGFSPSSTCP